jgi:hypothetical protein
MDRAIRLRRPGGVEELENMADKDAYREGARRVLAALEAGVVASVAATFPLDEAGLAQRAAKAGAIVLKPSA